MLDGFRQFTDQQVHMVDRRARDISRPSRLCQGAYIKRRIDIPIHTGLGPAAAWSRRRKLPAGHAIVAIIKDDRRQINIPAAGMDKMVPADRGAVAVPRYNNHLQLRVKHLDPRRVWQRPPVIGVQCAEISISVGPAGTADP